MNKERRTRIKNVVQQLTAIQTQLGDIAYDEREAFDNLPESQQESERGEAMEQAADDIESASDSIEDAIDYLANI